MTHHAASVPSYPAPGFTTAHAAAMIIAADRRAAELYQEAQMEAAREDLKRLRLYGPTAAKVWGRASWGSDSPLGQEATGMAGDDRQKLSRAPRASGTSRAPRRNAPPALPASSPEGAETVTGPARVGPQAPRISLALGTPFHLEFAATARKDLAGAAHVHPVTAGRNQGGAARQTAMKMPSLPHLHPMERVGGGRGKPRTGGQR